MGSKALAPAPLRVLVYVWPCARIMYWFAPWPYFCGGVLDTYLVSYGGNFIIAVHWHLCGGSWWSSWGLRGDSKGIVSSPLAISPEKQEVKGYPLGACPGARELCSLQTCCSFISRTAKSLTSAHQAVISFSAVVLIISDTFGWGKQHHRCVCCFSSTL